MNVVDEIFARAAARRGGGTTALVEVGAGSGARGRAASRAIRFDELEELVEATAHRLRASAALDTRRSVPRVGLAAPNGIAYVVLALAVLRAGGCLVPLAGELAVRERRALLRAVRPRAVVALGGGHAAAGGSGDGAGERRGELSGSDQRRNEVDGARERRDEFDVAGAPATVFAVPEEREPPAFGEEALAALDPAFIRFSSGTTGASKGVVLSHRTLVERIDSSNGGLGIVPGDRVLWVMSMAHHFAASILLYLAHGATTVLVRSHLAADVLGAARRHAATVFYASPFHYALLAADRSGAAWPELRLAVSTAAALPPTVARAFDERFGVPIAQALGIIEAGIVALNRAPRERPESVGRPVPAWNAELRDESGRVVPAGAVGELFVRGPGMLDAYLWPFRTRDEILADGWFATGDLAVADEDGGLRLVGRASSVINVSGMKCFPEEIEAVLSEHPEVAAVRVVGRAHPHVGAVPVADVVPRDPARPPEAHALAAHCRAALARFKVPVAFNVVASLPRTASGKVKR